MIEKLMIMYQAYMVHGSTGLIPHLVGPPGSGKSSAAEDLADLLGVHLHIIGVSRLSPLEVEGVQMPVEDAKEWVLRMLPATYWTKLKEGDIVLLDEFLTGQPQVFNAMLDIFTSRKAGSFKLPKVFIMAASNTAVVDNAALKDRILNIPVADPRKRVSEKTRLARMLVDATGMNPQMEGSLEMGILLDEVVLPMFDVLDGLFEKKGRLVGSAVREGKSVRNLISQVLLRYVVTSQLKLLIQENNRVSIADNKYQYVILLGPEKIPPGFESKARALVGNPRLTDVQRKNLELNLQFIELAKAKKEGTK